MERACGEGGVKAYCTRKVRWPMPARSSLAMGDCPSDCRSSSEADATVGGSWRVSPTMTSCSARAAARAHSSAGSVDCAAPVEQRQRQSKGSEGRGRPWKERGRSHL